MFLTANYFWIRLIHCIFQSEFIIGPHATFSGDRKSVVLELKDGEYGDADGGANGSIVDPSGPGIAMPPAQPSSNEGAGGGCFIGVAAF